MGPIWGRQDPGGPYVGPMDFAIWGYTLFGLMVKDHSQKFLHIEEVPNCRDWNWSVNQLRNQNIYSAHVDNISIMWLGITPTMGVHNLNC